MPETVFLIGVCTLAASARVEEKEKSKESDRRMKDGLRMQTSIVVDCVCEREGYLLEKLSKTVERLTWEFQNASFS